MKATILIAAVSCYLMLLTRAAPLDQSKETLNNTRVVFGEETILPVKEAFVVIWHMEPDLSSNGTSLLFSWGSSLRTSFDGTAIVGSIDMEGYVEGKGIDARFNEITSFKQISETQIVVVDRSNHCLRMVDRVTATTSHLAGKCTERGYADGIGDAARFFSPSDILLDERNNKSLIVVDCRTHSLREFDVNSRLVTTIVQNGDLLNRVRSATFDMNDKNTLYITSTSQVVRYSFLDNSLKVLAGDREVRTFTDGTLDNAFFSYLPTGIVQLHSDLLAVADYWNHDIRLIHLKHNQVTSLCHPRGNDSFVEGVGCLLDNPHGLLYHNDTLYVGDSTGIITIPVSFIEPGKPAPNLSTECKSRDIKVIMAAGEDAARIKLDSEHTLLLSAGKHQYMSEDCIVNILVKAATMERRVEFRADYDFECADLDNDVTKKLVTSSVESNFIHILEVCTGVCTYQKDGKPLMICSGNILSVFYPTNLAYDENFTTIPQDVFKKLTAKLASKGTMLSIVDISKNPPILYPRGNADGSSASLVLIPSCLNNMNYDKAADTCTDRAQAKLGPL